MKSSYTCDRLGETYFPDEYWEEFGSQPETNPEVNREPQIDAAPKSHRVLSEVESDFDFESCMIVVKPDEECTVITIGNFEICDDPDRDDRVLLMPHGIGEWEYYRSNLSVESACAFLRGHARDLKKQKANCPSRANWSKR